MIEFDEYAGFSYSMASREGARLIESAAKSGNWHSIVDRLAHLREVMLRQMHYRPTPPVQQARR